MRIAALCCALLLAAGCQEPPAEALPPELADLPGRVLHESAFALDPTLRATPADTLIFTLEASALHAHDTGGVGYDRVPVQSRQADAVPFCLQDDEAGHYLLVRDAAGAELLQLESGACASLSLTAGQEVFYELHHGAAGLEAAHAIVFISPQAPAQPREAAGSAPLAMSGADTFAQAYPRCDSTLACCWWDPKLLDWDIESVLPCTALEPYTGTYAMAIQPYRNCGKDGSAWPCQDITDYCASVLEDGTRICASWAGGSGPSSRHSCTQSMCDSWSKSLQAWCATRAAQCQAATTGAIPSRCAGSVARVVPYSQLVSKDSKGALQISLAKGEVGVIPAVPYMRGTSQCPPEYPDQPVFVLKGNCPDLGFLAHGLIVGAETQAVGYDQADYRGQAYLLRGLQQTRPDACSGDWPDDRAGHLHCGPWQKRERYRSIAISTFGHDDPARCPVLQSGQWCDFGGACPAQARSTIDYPAPGEALILGELHPAQGSCCAPAHLLPTGLCTDLALIGLGGQLYGTILPNRRAATDPLGRSTEYPADGSSVTAFAGTAASGSALELTQEMTSSDPNVNPLGHFKALPSSGGVTRATARSLRVLPLQGRNRLRVIQTNACENCDLTGAILCGQDLTGVKLAGADLSGAALNNALLRQADLSGARLDRASLDGALLDRTNLTCVSMRGVNTRAAGQDKTNVTTLVIPEGATQLHDNADGAASCRSDYSGAVLPIQLLPRSRWTLLTLEGAALIALADGYDLKRLDLSHGRLRGLTMGGKKLNLWGATLDGADLRRAELAKVDLGADCSGTTETCARTSLKQTLLNEANLSYANLWQADLSGAYLNAYDDAKEPDGDGKPTHYSGARAAFAFLRDVNFGSAHLEGVNFSYAHLYGDSASLAGALLRNVSFTNAVLAGVDFRGSQISGADFSGAVLINADFSTSNTSITATPFTGAFIQGASFDGTLFFKGDRPNDFTNAYPSTSCLTWTFRGLDCVAYQVQIDRTAFPTGEVNVICPSSAAGPCTPDKMIPGHGLGDSTACVPGQSGPVNEWYSPCSPDSAASNQPQTVPPCQTESDCGCVVSLDERDCS